MNTCLTSGGKIITRLIEIVHMHTANCVSGWTIPACLKHGIKIWKCGGRKINVCSMICCHGQIVENKWKEKNHCKEKKYIKLTAFAARSHIAEMGQYYKECSKDVMEMTVRLESSFHTDHMSVRTLYFLPASLRSPSLYLRAPTSKKNLVKYIQIYDFPGIFVFRSGKNKKN